jgi:hypothetical protein
MLKYFLQLVMFGSTMFAAGAPAVGGNNAATTDPGSSGGTGGAAGAGNGTGGQGAGDRSAQNAGAPPQDQGLKQLREAYEGVKAKFEPYEQLNVKPEQIKQYSGVYQKVYNEASAVGRELGYPDAEIAEALAEDPLRTIEFLRNQVQAAQDQRAQAGGPEQLEDLVRQYVEPVLGPIQQRENQRMTDSANQLFEQTTRQLAVESFKAEGIEVGNIPPDEMDFLMTATSEILKYDDQALHSLKYEGKTSSVQKAFQEARTALDKYYLARSGREKAKLTPARPGAPAAPQNGGRKPTLDEMIENPALVNAKYV